jgi:hypothetical protein
MTLRAQPSRQTLLHQEIYLGDEAFIERVQAGIKQEQRKKSRDTTGAT